MVSVFMVYGKELPVFGIELSPAFGADQAVDFEGLLPVIRGRSNSLTQFPDDLSRGFVARRLLREVLPGS